MIASSTPFSAPAGATLAQLQAFVPKQEFFVGIDSDGCALDVMTLKHERCFGPAAIEVFGLEAVAKEALETWLFINLYSRTRGYNRWVVLALFLAALRRRPEVITKHPQLPTGKDLAAFLASGAQRSDAGLAAYRAEHPSAEIDLCARWSQRVTELTAQEVPGKGHPFAGVKESIELLGQRADCMTISAARGANLAQEWSEHGLSTYMQLLAGQECGTKAQQLQAAAVGKYPPDHILLLGDAPGDYEAAQEAGVLFYPICAGREVESWRRLRTEALPRFWEGTYAGAYMRRLVTEFQAGLATTAPWEKDAS